MKKVLSMFLSLLMVVGIITSVPITASAVTREIDYIVFNPSESIVLKVDRDCSEAECTNPDCELCDGTYYRYNYDQYLLNGALSVVYTNGENSYYIGNGEGDFIDDNDDGNIIRIEDIVFSDDQAENHWYLNKHHYNLVTYEGHSWEIPISIIPSDIEALSFKTELPSVIPVSSEDLREGFWFYLADRIVPAGTVMTVKYANGEYADYDFKEIGSGWWSNDGAGTDGFGAIFENESASLEFGCRAPCYVAGFEIGKEYDISFYYENGEVHHTVSFVNIEDRVESINFTIAEPYEFSEETSGYTEEWLNPDTNQWETTYFYNGYHLDNPGNILTVNYIDGTSVDYTYTLLDGWIDAKGNILCGYPSCYDYQAVDPWGVDKDNYFVVQYMNKTVNVPVTIVENPVVSISYTPAKPLEYIENVEGYWVEEYVYDEETGEESYPQWFMYCFERITGDILTVNYKDGSSVDYVFGYDEPNDDMGFINAEGESIYPNEVDFSSNQSYKNQWTKGNTYDFVVTYMGRKTTVSAEIFENPVVSMTYTPVKPVEYIEDIDSSMAYDEIYNEETGEWEWIEWKQYFFYPQHGDIITVDYNDGTSADFVYDHENNGFLNYEDRVFGRIPVENIDIYSDQKYNTPWGAGAHEFVVSYMGIMQDTVSVTVVENPIESFFYTPVAPIEFVENIDGYLNGEWIYDKETGEEIYVKWYYYYFPRREGDILTVNYTDGTSKEYVLDDLGEEFIAVDGEKIYYDTIGEQCMQSYYNQWSAGNTYTYDFWYMGRETSVPVKVVENPVESISYTPAQSMEWIENNERYGYYETEWYWDEYTDEEYCYEWFRYDYFRCEGDILTVHNKDGSSEQYVYDGNEYISVTDGSTIPGWEVIFYDNQSYERQWSVGNTYEINVSYAGASSTLSVEIVEPKVIEEISFTLAEPIELYHGNFNYGYNIDIWNEGNVLTIHYTDGSQIEYTYGYNENCGYYEFNDENGVALDGYVDTVAGDADWTVGPHTATVKYEDYLSGGVYSTEIDVSVVENPIASVSLELSEEIEFIEALDSWFYIDKEGTCFNKYSPSIWDIPYGSVLTVNYKDGTAEVYTLTKGYDDFEEIYYPQFETADGKILSDWDYRVFSDEDDNHWQVGENFFSISVFGVSANIPVTVRPSHVKSITIDYGDTIVYEEGTNGWLESTYVEDENGERLEEYYMYDYWLGEDGWKMTVNHTDGTSKEYTCRVDASGDKVWCDDSGSGDLEYVSWYSNQSYENQWGVGKHYVTAGYMGKLIQIPIIIVPEGGCTHTDCDWITASEADCVTTGSRYKECTLCGKTVATETIEALGHDYSTEWTIDKEATCTEDGSKSHHCLRCDDKADVTVIEAAGHSYGDWVVTKEATCTEAGAKNKTCSACGDFVTETIDALGHDYSTEWTVDKEATCTEDGSKSHHCSRCDDKADVTVIEAAGHSYGDWIVTKEATCTESGTKTKTCSVCGDVVAETIDAFGHDYSAEWTVDKEATCTENGSKSHHCSRCDDKADVTVIEAAGHSYGDWVVTKEATCTEAGAKTKTCSVCGDVVTETIDALGHDYSAEWTVDEEATCTENGSKSHHCSRCDDKADVTVIEAAGHSYGDWVVTKEATCTESGTKTKTCSVCGDAQEEAFPATGHTTVINEAVVPTCTTDGKTEGSHCSVCNTVIKAQETIPATGHTSSSWITDKKATVNAAGSKHKECTECGEILEKATIKQLKCAEPTIKTIANKDYGARIEWKAVSGADSYKVYRKVSGGSYEYLGKTTKTAYADKTAKSGTKYYYVVKAANEAGNSEKSASKSITFLANPAISAIANKSTGVKISWGKVSGADSYKVYRKVSGGSYAYIGKATSTSYTDKTAKSGTKYYYVVKAVKDSSVSVKSASKSITFVGTPTMKTPSSTEKGITVKWSKVIGAEGYIVYRKTGSGSYEKLAKVKGGIKVSYVDKTAKKGKTYSYKLVAYKGSTKSAGSAVKTIKDKY